MYIDRHSHFSFVGQLVNYCWGHPATTLLLCPYGVVSSLVNHAPGEKANVQVVWSQKTTTHAEWWDMPIDKWAYDNGSGLSFEYIASRDIAAGEEVLIDYGAAWQAAWDAYPHQDHWYLKDELNLDIDSRIPTYTEWTHSQGDPLVDPNAVTLWCFSIYREIQGLPWAEDEAYPCKVILRNDTTDTYTVEIVMRLQNADGEESNDDTEKDQCFEIFDEVLWGVPRDALAFGGPFAVHDAHREHLRYDGFRHEMRIPDHLLPVAWRNVDPSKPREPE